MWAFALLAFLDSSPPCVPAPYTHAVAFKSAADAVQTVLSSDDLGPIQEGGAFIFEKARDRLPDLVAHLNDRREAPVRNLGDFFVLPRARLGEAKFAGHGMLLQNDVLVVAGRINWVLEQGSCRSFGPVAFDTPTPRLNLLKALWTRYLRGEDVGLRFGDPRAAALPLMSREAIGRQISELALVEVRLKAVPKAGSSKRRRDAEAERARIGNGLRLATGLKIADDAAAWDAWFLESSSYLYFDWKNFQMRVAANRRSRGNPLEDENVEDLAAVR